MPDPRATTEYVVSEGALLPRDLLARILSGDRQLPGIAAESYGLAPGEKTREAVSRAWMRLVSLFGPFDAAVAAAGERGLPPDRVYALWVRPLLQELGFPDAARAEPIEADGATFPVSHLAGGVAVHVAGSSQDLDRREALDGHAARSPHGLVQELLNHTPQHLWAMAINGRVLRLLRDSKSLTRQAYVEFDLEALFRARAFADFTLLWLVCHRTRFVPQEENRAESCWLEAWRKAGEDAGTRALDHLRDGVQKAIVALGTGFLAPRAANRPLHDRLRAGTLTKEDYYRQLLRLVYRLLFLFAAEDRGLLLDPAGSEAARQRYAAYYSTARLRRIAGRIHGTDHADLWSALRVVMGALGRDGGEPALALPALGSSLWDERGVEALVRAELPNWALLDAVRALSRVRDGRLELPVDFRNLGAEELGSVYESLLELHPQLSIDAGTFDLASAAGSERKTTGSYYTPPSLVSALLDTALDPVLDEATGAKDPEAALLALKVCDPACGSGHFLIAAAHRIARRLAAVRTGEVEPPPQEVRHALRAVIGHGIYGVDVNEMAVELCKVNLWMEALDPGLPLSFLDARIRCGNALLGATPELLAKGIPDEAFEPIEGDDRKVASAYKRQNKKERAGAQELPFVTVARDSVDVGELARKIASIDEDDIGAVHEKERLWAGLTRDPTFRRAWQKADTWCAAFVWPKRLGGPTPPTEDVYRRLLRGDSLPGDTAEEVERIAREMKFLHWYLAFPEVFEGGVSQSGFDVVLGNPPWERVKLQDKEFFATRRDDIADAPNAAARRNMIGALKSVDPVLYQAYERTLRSADAESAIIRRSGRYPLCGKGDVNTYAVFAEHNRTIMGECGRAGFIVPMGIATDDTTKDFFRDLIRTGNLASLYSFENEDLIFPGVHHALRFTLTTLSTRQAVNPDFVFYVRQVAQLAEEWRHFPLTASDLELLNPNTGTCPTFRSLRDAEINKRIYGRAGVFVREGADGGNPWGAKFFTMFHMANDSGLFRTAENLQAAGGIMNGANFIVGEERWSPLYEAKMIHQYDYRFGTYEGQTPAQSRQGSLPRVTEAQKTDPCFVSLPKYWVPEREVDGRIPDNWPHSWFIGWRGITITSNARTLIATVFPRYGAGHSLLLLVPQGAPELGPCLMANLNSFVLDYAARQKVGGNNLPLYTMKQLPVFHPGIYLERCPWSATESLAAWFSRRVGALVGPVAPWPGTDRPVWQSAHRMQLRAEIDAAMFILYGLTDDDAAHILDSFPLLKAEDDRLPPGERIRDNVFAAMRGLRASVVNERGTNAFSGE